MEKQKLTIGLVGLGGIAEAWISAFKLFDDVKILALADLDAVRVRGAIEKYQLSDITGASSVHEMLSKAKPDVVCDCTVPSAHFEVSSAALNAGCHVFSEKPLAATMEQAHKLCELAAKAGRTYAVMQNRRALADIICYRDLIRSGAIGPITMLNADFFIGAHFGGFRDQMDHVLLLDMAIHTFDMARFICGKEPHSVYCREWNPAGSWYHHGASAIAFFEMTDGVIFSYRGSWCAEGIATTWESNWRAIGQRGTACWEGDTIRGQAVSAEEGFMRPLKDLTIPPRPVLAYSGHAGILRECIDSLYTKTMPQTNCLNNIRSLAMVHAAKESADRGEKILIQQVMKGAL